MNKFTKDILAAISAIGIAIFPQTIISEDKKVDSTSGSESS